MYNIAIVLLAALIVAHIIQYNTNGQSEEFMHFSYLIRNLVSRGGFFPDIYNTTAEIKDLATKFIAVSALIMPFCSFSHASYFTLRSGGKTMVTFLFDSVFTWVVVVPVAFLLAHGTGLGIVSVYFLVQATELIKVVIGYCMVRSNVWVVKMV